MIYSDEAFKKIKSLYGCCRSYNGRKKLYSSYNNSDIVKYTIDTCRNLFEKDNISFDIPNLEIDTLIEKTSLCVMLNILEQLVYIQKIYNDIYSPKSNKSINYIKSDDYAQNLIKEDIDKDDFINKFHSLLKRTRQKNYGKIHIKYKAFFKFYVSHLFKETASGYHTEIYTPYQNISDVLFSVPLVMENSCLHSYVLITKPQARDLLFDLQTLYKNVCKKTADLNYQNNMAEFILIERLFGVQTISHVINQNNYSKMTHAFEILNYISFFGYTPLHEYILKIYDDEKYEDFSICMCITSNIICHTMQSIIYAIIERFKNNDKTIEIRRNKIDEYINVISSYLKINNIKIPESPKVVDYDKYTELYENLMVSEDEIEFLEMELSHLNISTDNMKGYIIQNIIRSHFGISVKIRDYIDSSVVKSYKDYDDFSGDMEVGQSYLTSYNKKKNTIDVTKESDIKQNYISTETFSFKKYIHHLYGISSYSYAISTKNINTHMAIRP